MNSNNKIPSWTLNLPLKFQMVLPVLVALILFAMMAVLVGSKVSTVKDNMVQSNERIRVTESFIKINLEWANVRVISRDIFKLRGKDLDDQLNKLKSEVNDIVEIINNELISNPIVTAKGKEMASSLIPLLMAYLENFEGSVNSYKEIDNQWDSAPFAMQPITDLTTEMDSINDPEWAKDRVDFANSVDIYISNLSSTIWSRQIVQLEQTYNIRDTLNRISSAYSDYPVMNKFMKNQLKPYFSLHDNVMTEFKELQDLDTDRQNISKNIISTLNVSNTSNSKIESALSNLSLLHIGQVNVTQWLTWLVAATISIMISLYVVSKLNIIFSMLSHSLSTMSERNITQRTGLSGKNILAQLGQDTDKTINRMNDALMEIRDQSNEVASSATELAAVMVQSAANAEEQSAQIEQIAAAITELSSSAEMVADSIKQTETQSSDAMELCNLGRNIAEENKERANELINQLSATAKVVESLKQRCENIEEVATVINNISDQTNLLALNAAIEAARAGEHGRGFAVVADEVRQLAAKTQSSTVRIHDIIKELQSQSVDAKNKVADCSEQVEITKATTDESFQQLSLIYEAVSGISSGASAIAVASEQQSRAAEEISEAINGAKDMITQNVAGIDESSKTSNFLSEIAEKQRTNIERFKLG